MGGIFKKLFTKLWKILIVSVISYGVMLGVAMGCLYLIFNLLLKSSNNYLTSPITFTVALVCWLLFMAWVWDYSRKLNKKATNNPGLMQPGEFKKIGIDRRSDPKTSEKYKKPIVDSTYYALTDQEVGGYGSKGLIQAALKYNKSI